MGSLKKGPKKRKSTVEEVNETSSLESEIDSDAQFLKIVANHFREPSLSKRAKLELQGEILAAIAKHVS